MDDQRPSIRIQAQDFRHIDTVSGDVVHTAELTWYRNGQRALPTLREILWVDEKKRELRLGYVNVADPTAPTVAELTSPFRKEF